MKLKYHLSLVIIILLFLPVQLKASFKNDTIRAGNIYRKAMCLSDSARYDSAIVYFNRAAEIYKQRKVWDKYLQCRGMVFANRRSKGEKYDAKAYIIENLNLSREKLGENHVITGNCYNHLGNVYRDMTIPDTALLYFQKALEIWNADTILNQDKIADAHHNFGIIQGEIGNYDSALMHFEKALKMFKNKYGENHLKIAMVYTGIMWIYYCQSEYEKCLEYCKKALTIRQNILGNNHPQTATSYNNIGVVLQALGKYNEALEIDNKVLQIRLATLGQDHKDVALIYNNIGSIYIALGQYGIASQYHKKALDLRLRLFNEKHPDVIMSYANIGLINVHLGIFDEALKLLRKVNEFDIEKYGIFHKATADSYNNLGIAFDYMEVDDSAIYYYKKALDVSLKIFSPHHQDVASSYMNIGSILLWQGDYDAANRYFFESLAIHLEGLGKEHPDVADTYTNISSVYSAMGDYDKALQYLNLALDIYKKVMGEQSSKLVADIHHIAKIYGVQKKYEESIKYFKHAIAIQINEYGEQHPDVALNYTDLANVYFEMNDSLNAFETLNKAIDIYNNILCVKSSGLTLAYNNLGDFYFKFHDYHNALQSYQSALKANSLSFSSSDLKQNPPNENVIKKNEMVTSLQKKAKVLFEIFNKKNNIEDLKLALSTIDRAIDMVDDLRKSYKLDESKLHFVEKSSEVFSLGCDIAYMLYKKTHNSKYLSELFNLSQQSKAQVLSEIIDQSHAFRFSGVPDSIVSCEKDLRTLLNASEVKLLQLKTSENSDSIAIKMLEEKVFQYSTQYKEISDLIEAKYPRFNEIMKNRDIPSISAIQQKLDKETVLLDYYMADRSLYIFVITQNNVIVHKSNIDSTLNIAVEQLLSGIRKNRDELFISSSNQLYHKLIFPIASYLQGKKRLLIIPDKTLLNIPFEALISKEPKAAIRPDYMVLHFNIVYNYSAALAFNQNKQKGNIQESDHMGDFIGFAPVFQNSSSNIVQYTAGDSLSKLYTSLRSVTDDGKTFQPLVNSEKEIINIVNLFKSNGLNGIGFLYNGATETNFKKEVEHYKYVHIATHGISNDEYPSLSGLVFTKDSLTSNIKKNDGILFAGEIFDLNLNANLVILSACESGTGKLIRGEGLMALTRGFIYAGVPQIIYSLWKVDDHSTSELMAKFYEGILQNKPIEQSLKEAKLRLLNNPTTSLPRFWAAFNLLSTIQ
jgi:CHAT domain-containing protein/Tfp pilus assembly protein PilF